MLDSAKNSHKRKYSKTNSNSCNREESEKESSLYKSPGKLKAKAQISKLSNEGTSSEKVFKKLKQSRIKYRRKTNPEETKSSKYLLTAKKHCVSGRFSPVGDTPKTIHSSSKMSSNNSRGKENIAMKCLNRHKMVVDCPSNKNLYYRKNSNQVNKIGTVVFTTNRTLLKPRKNIKNISGGKIKALID